MNEAAQTLRAQATMSMPTRSELVEVLHFMLGWFLRRRVKRHIEKGQLISWIIGRTGQHTRQSAAMEAPSGQFYPECFRSSWIGSAGGGPREKYSEKADVYSFGVIMWEVATRKQPFAGRNFMPPSSYSSETRSSLVVAELAPSYDFITSGRYR
jgi:serine/threonine protein kinase